MLDDGVTDPQDVGLALMSLVDKSLVLRVEQVDTLLKMAASLPHCLWCQEKPLASGLD